MTTPDLPARLRDALTGAGFTYDRVAEVLGPQAHDALARNETTPGLRRTAGGSPVETLVRLFLLQAPVAIAAAERALPGLVDQLAAEGILEHTVGEVAARLDVRPYAAGRRDLWVVSDLTPGLDGGPNRVGADHVLGISPASTSLAQLTVREPVGRSLDLGTGCGVQALHLADHSGTVVATDVNARALRITRFNAALNDVDNVDVRDGSFFEPVRGERFDLIATNPPFVISPATGRRLVYRDSGLPGDQVVEHIVRTAPDHLTEGGWCQVLANWVISRGVPWEERLAGWVTDECDAFVVQREVVDPAAYVELWLKDAGLHGSHDYLDRYDTWLSWFEEQGIEAVGFGWVNLRRRQGDDHRRTRGTPSWTGRTTSSSRSPRPSPPGAPPSTARSDSTTGSSSRGRPPGDARRPRRRGPDDRRAAPAARPAARPSGRHGRGRAGRRLRRRPDGRPDPGRARPAARPRPGELRATYLPVVRELVEEGFLTGSAEATGVR